MGYSSYLDKDSNNILYRYDFINESIEHKKQIINEAVPLLAFLPQILGLLGISAAAGVILQKLVTPETKRALEDIFSKIKQDFETLGSIAGQQITIETATAAAAALNSIGNTLASVEVASVKSLSRVFIDLSNLINSAVQDKITERQAYEQFFKIQEQFYQIINTGLTQVQYSPISIIANLQKRLVTTITAEITKAYKNLEQEREETLKRIDAGRALEPSAPPPLPPQDPKDPKEKSWIMKFLGFVFYTTLLQGGGRLLKWTFSTIIGDIIILYLLVVHALPLISQEIVGKFTGGQRPSEKIPGLTEKIDKWFGELLEKAKTGAQGMITGMSQTFTGNQDYTQRTKDKTPEEIQREIDETNRVIDELNKKYNIGG